MKWVSQLLVLILSITLIFSSLSFAVATSQQEQAEILNAIKILKGNEDGYNLSGKLRRSEAATLVVRMMGEESTVLNNKDTYTVSAFSDVKSSDWFSPYVGYCYKNGIILGFPDGTFKPNDYISEKSFAQLVLGVMNYKSGTDFTWDTVKRFMYERGLVTDVVYTVSTNDNTNYTRGEAVTLLYNSLTKKCKNSDKSVCDQLIEKKVITDTVAKKYGFLKVDEEKTAIDKITVIDVNRLEVTFNEEIIVDAKDIEIYANGALLKIEDFETHGDTLKIDVDDELYDERQFEIKIKKVYDEEDYMIKDIHKIFTGMERPEIESKLFKISKVKPVSSEMLEIYFTQPIDESAKQVLLYEVYRNGALYYEGSYKTLDIQMNSTVNNGVIFISKQYKFENNDKYEIRIKSDLKSKYKAYLNDGNGDRYSFYGSSIGSEIFEVKQAEFIDTNNIIIVYSDLVDKDSATDKSNYYLLDEDNKKISVNRVYLDEYDEDNKYKKVILGTQDLKDYHEYRLFIDDVENVFKTLQIENYEEDLGEGMKNDEEIRLDDIEVVNRSFIQLKFDTPLDDASEKASITINKGIRVSKKIVDPQNPKILNVYLSKSRYLKEDNEYELKISKKDIFNIYKNTHEDEIIEKFDGSNSVREEIVIQDAHFISDSQILVKFSDYIKETSVENEKNYSFEYHINGNEKILFAGDIEVVDEKTVIINFDYFLQDGKLYIEIDNIYDIAGQYQYNDLKERVELLSD
jgi:hypothetical protein